MVYSIWRSERPPCTVHIFIPTIHLPFGFVRRVFFCCKCPLDIKNAASPADLNRKERHLLLYARKVDVFPQLYLRRREPFFLSVLRRISAIRLSLSCIKCLSLSSNEVGTSFAATYVPLIGRCGLLPPERCG